MKISKKSDGDYFNAEYTKYELLPAYARITSTETTEMKLRKNTEASSLRNIVTKQAWGMEHNPGLLHSVRNDGRSITAVLKPTVHTIQKELYI
ncbi:hypothetical protein ACD661_01545 [Legionella lytica]|uniref:Uncharacterized protein n=1 Tax=Legionella lytica TaxID=96232 RepID=A0ABW8D3H9_9GAMM